MTPDDFPLGTRVLFGDGFPATVIDHDEDMVYIDFDGVLVLPEVDAEGRETYTLTLGRWVSSDELDTLRKIDGTRGNND